MLPEPPAWAIAAGLPAPAADEHFHAYCIRLGFDPASFYDDLTPQTEPLANRRLAHRLRADMPRAWQAHIDERVSEQLTPERRRELQTWGRSHLPPRDI